MRMTSENVKKKGEGKAGKFSSTYPLLVQRQKEWGYDIPTYQPRGTNIIVWRLPPLTETPSGLLIPEDHQSPHVKGILLAAGPKAMDSFESDGITLGHVVSFKRYSGVEINDQTPEALRGCRILQLDASDILGSDDLRQMLESGKASYVKGADGRHSLAVKAISDKKAKVLKLAADPSATPAERATATRLAAKL